MSELSVNLNASFGRTQEASPSELVEQRLMARVAANEEQALSELIERYGGQLYQLVGRLVGWHADRDDVFQEVLLTIWRKAGRFDASGSLEGWLKRIAVNHVKNHFRAANRLRGLISRFAEKLGGEGQPVGYRDPISPIEDERQTELKAALQRLNTTDRMAVVLFYLEEIPGDVVAEMLDIKPSTLHVRLHRAKKKLKRYLEAYVRT